MNSTKKGLWIVSFATIGVLLVAMILLTNLNIENSSVDNQNELSEIVDLVFSPVALEPLNEGKPALTWERIKTLELDGMSAKLQIYLEKGEDSEETNIGHVYGFIEQDNDLYEIGLISAYGFEDVIIEVLDRTNDLKNEVQIIGGVGASYVEMKIISFDEDQGQWVNLLTMGTPYIFDLDGDGEEELVAESSGSIPGYLDIYRWNGEHFVKASVTESTKNFYAYLYNTGSVPENNYKQDGVWIIETGKPFQEPEIYRYDKGKLVKIRVD